MIRCEKGTTAVEFALLLPAFLGLMMGIMDMGRLLWTQASLQLVAEEGARCASLHNGPCSSLAAVQGWVQNHFHALSLPAQAYAVAQPACGNRVSLSYAFQFVTLRVIPVMPSQITLAAVACAPTQP